MKRLAIPYIRFSDRAQAKGASVERQRKYVDDWMARHGDEFTRSTDEYEDLGVSGYSGAHIVEGNLGRLLQAVETGRVPAGSVILVEALDRFTRLQPLDILPYVQTIIKAGVSIITLEDKAVYDKQSLNGDALLMFVMKARAAFEYSQRLSGRIADSYDNRAKTAKSGAAIKRRNGFWLTSDGTLIPEAAGVVKEVFQRYVDGATIRAIARDYPDYLKNTASVRHLLRNPAVIGHWQRYKTWKVDGKQHRAADELIESAFEPAIEPALFYQAQALQDKEKTGPVTVARVMPLAGLVVCAECGGNFVLLKAGNNSFSDTMRCYHRIFNKASCTNAKTIPVQILWFVFTQTSEKHMRLAWQRTRLPELQKQRVTLEGKVAETQKALRGIERLVTMNPDDESLMARYQEEVNKRKQLEAELQALPASVDDVGFDLGDYMRWMRNDIFARCKTLQIDGYRIRCGADGRVAAGVDDAVSFSGRYTKYVRKERHYLFDVDGGNATTIPVGTGSLSFTGKVVRIGAPALGDNAAQDAEHVQAENI